MKRYEVFVPTYNRSNPAILQMLNNDRSLSLTLCVRDELLQSGFYDELAKLDRVKILNLGKNVCDIGETRKKILEYVMSNEIEYCVMLDDGLTNIKNVNNESETISQCIEHAITRIENNSLSSKVLAYGFWREKSHFVGVSEHDLYFVGILQQAYIINCEVANSHHIQFKSLDIVGFEDAAFMLDGIKTGLICIGGTDLIIEGKQPNTPVLGGNHSSIDLKELVSSYDKKSNKLLRYVGHMYGVSFEKKYRESMNCELTYCIINYAYFRDTLVFHRHENENIINSQFTMK